MVWCSFISSQSTEPECHITNRSTGHQKRTAFGSLRWRSGAGYLSVMSKGESSRMEREDLVLEESTRVALITLAAGEESPWHHHSAVTEQVVCVSGKKRSNSRRLQCRSSFPRGSGARSCQE